MRWACMYVCMHVMSRMHVVMVGRHGRHGICMYEFMQCLNGRHGRHGMCGRHGRHGRCGRHGRHRFGIRFRDFHGKFEPAIDVVLEEQRVKATWMKTIVGAKVFKTLCLFVVVVIVVVVVVLSLGNGVERIPCCYM